jgi:hypothetical protein
MNKKLIGALLLIIALGLAWYWFDYKLSIIIFLALTGNKFEQSK